MANYKLYYFPGRGGAEVIRFVFAQANVQYEDKRIARDKWMEEFKENSPFGCMPFLEVDGKRISGGFVCARFLAEKYGLAGKDAFENAEIASVGDAIHDLEGDVVKFVFEKDPEAKAKLQKELKETKFPMRFKYLERQAAKADEYFFGKVTWVDFTFYLWVEIILKEFATALDEFPKLKGIMAKVPERPNIKKWIAERPESSF
jgi:glutathione S-transferase